MGESHHHHISPGPYRFHNRFALLTHRILESVQEVESVPWDRMATLDQLRRRVATIEALMFACDTPPILITLVEDLYQSIGRLEDPRPSFGRSPSLRDAG